MGVNKAQIKSPSGLLKLGALVRHDFFKSPFLGIVPLFIVCFLWGRIKVAYFVFALFLRGKKDEDEEKKQHTHAPIRHEGKRGGGKGILNVGGKGKKLRGIFLFFCPFFCFSLTRNFNLSLLL